jgi:uncharacterized damage-inducible protein DinB
MKALSARPAPDEHIAYYSKYIDRVRGEDIGAALAGQIGDTQRLLAPVSDQAALHRYAPGKWSVKEVIGHLIDAERIMSYRALRFGRGDSTPLPGFDENQYVPVAQSDRRPIEALRSEFSAVRAATLGLLDSFDEPALLRRGSANGDPITVRSLLWIIAGHELHHVALLRERYGLEG